MPEEPIDRPPLPGRPMPPMGALSWTFALWTVELLCIGITEAIRPGARTDIVNVAACRVLATSLVGFAMVRVHAPDASLRETFGIRPLPLVRVLLAVAAGAGLTPAVSALETFISGRWPETDPDAIEGMQRMVASSSRVTLVVGALVVVPLAAELFFRGILFGELRRTTSTPAAVLVTTVLFALAYAVPDVRALPTFTVLGVAFAWLRARSGGVVAPVIAHLSFCAVDGIPILRGRDPVADVVYPTRWIVGGLVVALLALAAIGSGRNARALARD